jgi:hypothetical protein
MKRENEGDNDIRLAVLANCQKDENIILDVEWNDEKEAIFHDYLFIKSENEKNWKMISSFSFNNKTRTSLQLHSGKTQIGICPSYKISDYMRFLEGIKSKSHVMEETIGYSAKKLPVSHLVISKKTEVCETKEKCLVIGRCHSSETAGSYCAEGMINFLISGGNLAEFFLRRYDFHFLPLLNVDGVFYGYSRASSANGTDLNRDFDYNKRLKNGAENDPVLKLHFELIDKLKPTLYLNLHNWCSKFKDGLIGWDKEDAALFQSFFPHMTDDFKNWAVNCSVVPGARSPGRYSKETWKTIGFNLEFPWYGRSIDKMREIGKTALIALVHTGINKKQERNLKNEKN